MSLCSVQPLKVVNLPNLPLTLLLTNLPNLPLMKSPPNPPLTFQGKEKGLGKGVVSPPNPPLMKSPPNPPLTFPMTIHPPTMAIIHPADLKRPRQRVHQRPRQRSRQRVHQRPRQQPRQRPHQLARKLLHQESSKYALPKIAAELTEGLEKQEISPTN